MADEPVDLTHELLRQIRAEIGSFREATEHRFSTLESDMLEMRQAMRGLTYMMASFNGRLEDMETRLDRMAAR